MPVDKTGLGGNSTVLTGASVIVGGKNTFGKTGEVKTPEWKFIIENEESTGQIESPMMEVPIMDLSKHYIASIMNGEDILLKGSLRQDGKDIPITMAVGYQVHELTPEWKVGESSGRTFKIRVDNYIEKVNGEETVKWNRKKIDLRFGGGDNLLSDYAANVL
jgi:hypothetical protein